jgi:hypothetical protein
MIGYALAEIRRLLIAISRQQPPTAEHAWFWSRWRRRRQYQARLCHYQRRGYPLTCALLPAGPWRLRWTGHD